MRDASELLLLLPKIRPPRFASKTVQRPRLAQCIASIEEARLTLVSAPSGFGKTTLGIAWARELRNRGEVVGWLSLDKDDNDPSRFFDYLAFAINHALKVHSTGSASARSIVRSPLKGSQLLSILINSIAEDGSEFFLFLDDFQVITDVSIRESIQFLIRNAPSNFHLVVLSHPKGVADLLKSKSETLLHLNASDLRFSEREARDLFEAHSRCGEEASSAHSITGGWAAALQILAACNVTADGGNVRLLTEDYLSNLLDIVLAGLTADEIRLIETTCITGRMCAPLFSELTGIVSPKNIIHSVEHRHCLIAKVSEDGYWFSCHDLLRESMIARLSGADPAFVTDVAHRASRWYAEQGYWSEAVNQALSVNDRELALRTIESCAAKLMYKGDVLTIIGWENRLGLSADPSTSVKTLTVLAFALIIGADQEHNARLNQLLELTDARMRRELSSEGIKQVHWHLQGIRSVLACRNDDVALALDLSAECLGQPAIFASLTEIVKNAAGYSYLQLRQWDEFYRVLTEVPAGADKEFFFLQDLYRQTLLGLAAIVQLNFSRGLRYLEAANRLAHDKLGTTSLPGALASGLMAFIQCERLELTEAERRLNGVIEVVAQSGYIDCTCRTYTAACRIAALRHENEYALGMLNKWEKTAAVSGSLRSQILCAYEKLCLFLRMESLGDAKASLAEIIRLYESAAPGCRASGAEPANYAGLARAQFALASGNPSEAVDWASTVYQEAIRGSDPYMTVLSGIVLALAELALDKTDSALAKFASVLTLAQPAGLKAAFLIQPGGILPMLDICKKHVARGPGGSRLDAFIDELEEAHGLGSHQAVSALTPREESVLRLIAQDKSNKEISIELKITPETVKTYLKRIFVKLNVTKRNAAVRRAAALRLL